MHYESMNLTRKVAILGVVIVMQIMSLLICISAFEIYLRTQYRKGQSIFVSKWKSGGLYVRHSTIPNLIYEYIPNKWGNNSRGYFDYEYSYKKDTGVFRILIIGDSIAAGFRVKLEQNFGKILERKLNNSIKSKKF